MTNHIQMSGNEMGWSMWIKISQLTELIIVLKNWKLTNFKFEFLSP